MNFRSIFKHYWRFLRNYKLSQVMILIGFGLGSLTTIGVIPLIYKRIIDLVSTQPPNAYDQLSTMVILLAVAIIAHNAFFRFGDYFLINSQSKIIKELYDHSLEGLQKHSYTFFSNAFVGGLVAKTKRFVHAFEVLHDQFIFQIWMSGISLFASLSVLWYQSWMLGSAFLIWLIFYMLLVRLMVKWQIPKSLANAEADTRTTSRYADIITNIITMKMFGSNERELEDFKKTTDYHESKRTEAWMQQSFWNGMIQSATIGVFNIAIIWLAVDLWKGGVVPAGTIVLVQLYVISSFNIVRSISKNIIRISTALTDANEMVNILDRDPGVMDVSEPKKISITKGKIEFKGVTFSYDKSDPVFDELDLVIKPGEKVALVGHSGAGKTTVVKLLLRFTDIQKGTITIDGQDITQVPQEDLRKEIAYVPQDPSLFHRTLKENISYAKPGASFSEVVEIAKHAQAHEFIERLPKGYDTLVGERGIKLSGGERQRVAIARAMLKNSPIVILDEATSSLDTIAEEKIQMALEKLMKGKTTIAIAHRLSTIRKMDRIIVFEKGRISESGTHRSLLQKKGLYSKLWKSQVGGFINQ